MIQRLQLKRENIFRGKLFCECCGHPLTISKKKLVDREVDVYVCMYHYSHPEMCPKAHQVNHEMLCTHILKQIQHLARSMRRRKINSPITEYATIEEITQQTINKIIERIEVGHVTRKSKTENAINIQWKLNHNHH